MDDKFSNCKKDKMGNDAVMRFKPISSVKELAILINRIILQLMLCYTLQSREQDEVMNELFDDMVCFENSNDAQQGPTMPSIEHRDQWNVDNTDSVEKG